MDAARTARRLGSENVYIVYRRSHSELPARAEEIEHAEEEGIVFKMLSNPVRFLGNDKGRVRKIVCQEMELGEPDASGRRRPVAREGCFFEIDTDLVIIAIGGGANPVLTKSTEGLGLNKRAYIVANENGRTTKPRDWAGGGYRDRQRDGHRGHGRGRKAANDIHQWLANPNGGAWLE